MKVCPTCQEPFERPARLSNVAWERRIYCSRPCRDIGYAAKFPAAESKVCAQCHETFEKPEGLNLSKWEKRIYCSHHCYSVAKMKDDPGRHAWAARHRKHRKDYCEKCGVTAASGAVLHLHHETRNYRDDSAVKTYCATCHEKLHWAEDWSGGRKKVGRPRKEESHA